jgi:hypothetical protein
MHSLVFRAVFIQFRHPESGKPSQELCSPAAPKKAKIRKFITIVVLNFLRYIILYNKTWISNSVSTSRNSVVRKWKSYHPNIPFMKPHQWEFVMRTWIQMFIGKTEVIAFRGIHPHWIPEPRSQETTFLSHLTRIKITMTKTKPPPKDHQTKCRKQRM